jgi:transcriptional regulator with XRE-family HTH domain|nr:MAG TPA_asm: putative transcriptional regulator [Caudoviricetes sp.]
METIQDLCWKEREAQRKTAQTIADESGISISTVNNYFSSASKQPSVYTVGPICKSLGVSLDRYFEIVPKGEDLTEREEALLTQQVGHEQDINKLLNETIKHKNRVIFALLFIFALALVYGITLDLLNPSMGLFRG